VATHDGDRLKTDTIAMDGVTTTQDQVCSIAHRLEVCLAELDALNAGIAAAHLDAGLQTLRRQFGLAVEPFEVPVSEIG
jgi:hypothetical protein